MAIHAVGEQEVAPAAAPLPNPSQPAAGEPVPVDSAVRVGSTPVRVGSTQDDAASQMLLLFFRLLGPRRQGPDLPRQVRALLKSGYLAPRHLRALAVITLAGPMTVSEVARQEGLALSTASLLVTQLADAGLVERHEDAGDRRRTVVSVAPRFQRESWAVLDSKLAPLRRALGRMGPRQTRVLLDGLRILMEEVSRSGEDTSTGETGAVGAPREAITTMTAIPFGHPPTDQDPVEDLR